MFENRIDVEVKLLNHQLDQIVSLHGDGDAKRRFNDLLTRVSQVRNGRHNFADCTDRRIPSFDELVQIFQLVHCLVGSLSVSA